MKVSVAMATFNGKEYVAEQLQSILKQLNTDDEVIISDDNSCDGTIELLRKYQQKDDRIFIYTNKRKGIISNFENAISKCKNDIIFLSDQDDVWLDNKVEEVKKCFNNNEVKLVLSDCYIVDNNLNVISDSFSSIKSAKKGIFRNIMKNSYLGCGMAFKQELKSVIIPIPNEVPMHDVWIGVLAEMFGEVKIIPDKLFYYRRHDSNATRTTRAKIGQMIAWRATLIKHLFIRKVQLNIKGKFKI